MDSLSDGLYDLAPPIINAMIVDFLLPRRLLWNIFMGLVGWPSWSLQALQWATAGYLDALYLSNEHHRSFVKICAYIGTLFARRGLFRAWSLLKVITHYTWMNASVVVAIGSCLGVSWYYGPQYWRRTLSKSLSSISVWIIIGLTNLAYGFTVILSLAWIGMGVAKRAIGKILYPLTPQFSYTSAPEFDPSSQVRLLRLHRRIPFCDVSAELISCSLDDAPSYYAISYVWSYGPQDIRTITLNGLPFQVRGNVYDILDRCSSFFGPRLIWIDTICIDQTNTSEKTLQVREMKRIYGEAEHALVCLGNGPAFLALGLMQELKIVRNAFQEAYVPGYVAHFFERRKTDFYLNARIDALQELLQHPWFRRVWVVQEAVVPREVTFFYGRQSVPWQDFYKSLHIVVSGPVISMFAALAPGDQLQNASSYMGILSLPFIVAYRHEYRLMGPQRLSHVLRVFGEREATLSIDKVFALVGLAKSYHTDIKVFVDYHNKSEDEILLDLANFLVDNGEADKVMDLAGIGRRGRNPNLPSWAVDWTMLRAGMTLNSTFSSSAIQYRAATGKPLKLKRGTSRRELIVRGRLCDKIAALVPFKTSEASETPSFATSLFSNQAPYLDEALDLARKMVHDPYPYFSHQPLEEAVWRTLIGDKTHTERPAPASYGKIIATLLRQLANMKDVFLAHPADIMFSQAMKEKSLPNLDLTKLQEFEEANREAQNVEFLFDSGKGSSPYLFCVTMRGYVGMVPELSRVGDGICLVHGWEVPYVLRRHEEKYKLVGDAYVHGIMDGQGLNVDDVGEELVLV